MKPFFVLTFISKQQNLFLKNFKTKSRMRNFQDFLFTLKRSVIIHPENYSLKLSENLQVFLMVHGGTEWERKK